MPVSFSRLPRLVKQEVLTNMNPFELFALSHCSKRCTELVPLANTKDYQFLIDLSKLTISIRTPNIQLHTFSFDGIIPGAWVVSSQNPKLELKNCLLKFFDLFHSEHICYFNTGTQDFDHFEAIANILIELNCIIGNFNFQIESVKEKELKNILEKLQITDCLNIPRTVQLSYKFECKLSKFPDRICINNSFWFGIDQLCFAVKSSIKIELRDSFLSIENMNSFLEKWMTGKFPDMTAFLIEIHSKQFDSNDQLVLGMQLPIQSEQRTVHKRYSGQFYGCVIDGIVFENVDGVKAVINFDTECTSCFSFMVLA
ncbi:hypothetical protein B9Z55_027265 [Caenorhabditis nigoni]|uniref:F-box domain-containing protein n=2 Tax=Caenorhabditis nigoni TaxID=1611254 RepID=A0A2G5SHD1_9PELO|nr:hypothetical protein B9Z55_027265 [Caenorhabditis nigoni]